MRFKNFNTIIKKIVSFLLIFSTVFSTFDFKNVASASTDDNNLDTQTIQIVDDGLYVNDIFYAIEEFETLLKQAVFVENTGVSTFAITSALAGTWFIPGIGQVVITTAGVVIDGGAIIAAGSWIYNSIEAYFAEKAYEEHKQKGPKTDGHTVDSNPSKLPTTGTPLTSRDRTADGSWNGKVLQRRYYDKNGNVDLDIDYTAHGNPKAHPKVPHRHDWKNGQRGPWY
ncbi:hypothetical protein [Metasolibacillus meyeri]|uniref:hypothetical protein n=1 Tax=Metasolibacillus meyeri TaxID=1071052 RepID=UPI000D31856E|nr:hypothetical protein [Metasolibacillus meyeri]